MFLQLLCTQLECQNPLDPMDTAQFTSQLVSYASLEQQINTNENLEELLSEFQTISETSAVGYIGDTVTVDSDTLSVESDGTVDASWTYDLDSTASQVTLTVTDSDGNTIWTGSGETSSGSHTFSWDGTDSDGDTVSAGDYTLTVTAVDSSGDTVSSSVAITGTVTGVSTSSGTVVLDLGDTSVDLDDITRIAA